MKEALRYLQNAKEILKKAPIEDGRYAEVYPERSRRVKYVQEACGTAYLAIIKAIDGHLMSKGLSKKGASKIYRGVQKGITKIFSSL